MDPMPNARKPSTHRIYLYFMLRDGWHCQFLEADLKTPLPRKLTFATSDKLLEIFERWGESRLLEDRSLHWSMQSRWDGVPESRAVCEVEDVD